MALISRRAPGANGADGSPKTRLIGTAVEEDILIFLKNFQADSIANVSLIAQSPRKSYAYSVFYYLDGYNFLFLVSKEVENLESSRNAFLDVLSEHLGAHANLNIVFDAHLQDRLYATKILRRYFEVIFTPEGQTADEYIIERVEMHVRPAQIVVVSSDKHLLRSCQQLGAKTQTVQEFLHLKRKKKKEESAEQEFHESPREIERLLKIFEKRLKEF